MSSNGSRLMSDENGGNSRKDKEKLIKSDRDKNNN